MPFEGKKGSLFDFLEDLDYDDCLAKGQAIAGASGKRPQGKQQAFVFIEPHALTLTLSLTLTKVAVNVHSSGAMSMGNLLGNQKKASTRTPIGPNPLITL